MILSYLSGLGFKYESCFFRIPAAILKYSRVLEVGIYSSTVDLKDVALVIDGVTGVLGSWTNSFLTYTGVKPRVTAQKLTIMVNLNLKIIAVATNKPQKTLKSKPLFLG